ncbi:hypothetical protein [Amycolatopsis sp. lyj-109]|uniref:hypothetical protein n=1 Tax=Amycolatopsis sp. lyj-109 TaxID=2789287 RepID=UPI003978D915
MRPEPETEPFPDVEPQAREPEPESPPEAVSPPPERKVVGHGLLGRVNRLLRRS